MDPTAPGENAVGNAVGIVSLDHRIPFETILSEHAARARCQLPGSDALRDALARLQAVKNSPAASSADLAACERECRQAALSLGGASRAAYEALGTEKVARKNRPAPEADSATLRELEKHCAAADKPLLDALHAADSSALCLSGGGIRSASFGLGVLQALSQYSFGNIGNGQPPASGRGFMQNLDYLSTVSGGGYIGSWFTAWIRNRGGHQAAYHQVIAELGGATAGATTTADPQPRPERYLRQYTSFLAPKLGLSLDAFTLAAIVLRNLFINWLLFAPLLLLAMAVPQLLYAVLLEPTWVPGQQHLFSSVTLANWAVLDLGLAAVALLALSGIMRRRMPPLWPLAPGMNAFLGLSMVAAVAITQTRFGLSAGYGWNHVAVWFLLALLGLLGVMFRPPARGLRLLAAIMAAALAGIALEAIAAAADGFRAAHPSGELYLVVGVPIVLGSFLVASSLVSAVLGNVELEGEREWWARTGARLLLASCAWLAVSALSLYGPGLWSGTLIPHFSFDAIAALAGGGLGAAAGAGGLTSAGTRALKGFEQSGLSHLLERFHLLLPAVCLAALAAVATGFAALDTRFATWLHAHALPSTSPWLVLLAWVAAAAFVTLLGNLTINFNTFSLHGMYRMRLMRAFLGASNPDHHPHPDTKFDPHDTRPMAQMPATPGVPLHLINTTLNLVGGGDLAWQERKAESFTFSPLACGAWRLGFVPTERYAGDCGPSQATAMAISGAALNPNMGYASSPLVGLVMTLLNARLGWWMPNPRFAVEDVGLCRQNSPRFALWPLLREAFGATTDKAKFVELTDGGHFENLALYEMVLRRCRRIIVVDAGADPDYQFDDLGNALRKIYIDLGIPIYFPERMPMSAADPSKNRYCATATIGYDVVDAGATNGQLIYIKAVLDGNEAPDIHQYAATHPTFPHESTVDQFYTESQFESYRHLGAHAVQAFVRYGSKAGLIKAGHNDFDSLFAAATAYSQS